MSGIIAYSVINEPTPRVIGNNQFANIEEENASQNIEDKKRFVEVKVEFKDKEDEDLSSKKVSATYTFPTLYLEDEAYTTLNNEIENNARGVFATLKQSMAENVESQYKFILSNKSYDAVLNTKQIVSMVVTEKMIDDKTKESTYLKVKSYNLNVTTREKISSYEAALEVYGTEYKTKVTDAINAYLISRSMKTADDTKYVYSGLESWYISEGEMHIMLNPGDAADEKFGVIDVVVPKAS